MPGTPAVCAGISLPVISIVVHWQDGCAPNTFSGLSDVLASLKFPSSSVCGATTPKSNPAGMAITLALAAGAEAARIGLPTGLLKADGAGVCALVGACANTTVDCTNAADFSAAIVFAHVRACAWANTVNTKICIRVCIFNNMYHGTAIADLDQDGKPELLIGSYNDTLYCLNGENGTTKWKYFGSGGYIGAPVSIGDIDHDGICDIVFVSGYKVTALSNNGTLKWSYNIPGYGGAFRGVALADITNDAYLDIVFGTDQGKVIALNGNNGTLIWAIDLATHYGNTLFAFDHAPLIADFNNDDTMEVFIVGGHAEYPNFYKDFGRAYMISAGKGNGPNWLMFQHDIRRQSSLCNFGPKGIMEAPAANKYVITTSPNPSAFSTRIQFQNPKNRKHVISIYDSKGLLLKQLTGITESEINIEHALWKNGIYFFRIQNELEIVGQGKFVILK